MRARSVSLACFLSLESTALAPATRFLRKPERKQTVDLGFFRFAR